MDSVRAASNRDRVGDLPFRIDIFNAARDVALAIGSETADAGNRSKRGTGQDFTRA
jgi:hypothetical protein